MDKSLTPDQRAELVLEEMTLDEKIQLVHGTGVHFMPGRAANPMTARSNGGLGFVPGVDRLGLPDLNLNDGSNGRPRSALAQRGLSRPVRASAASNSCISSEDSSTFAAPRFSSRRSSFRVPGIGTIHGRFASIHARAI
jgi:hypothetical protein